jgi:Zn-dependent peptidase ImmA (M78 family)/transcriptional regulator with XRE-family HTH domain
MTRVPVNPELITWAHEHAGREPLELRGQFPRLAEWESGEVQPTLRQLEDFARAVHVPVGYLFLPAPPVEALPIPDFRTLGDRDVSRPSPNLLDTLYLCQQSQAWYRDHTRLQGLAPVAFVGSAQAGRDVVEVADRLREALGLSVAERQRLPSWTAALRQLVARAEEAGVLVMASSIVGSNSHRKRDPAEFRGFALVDDLAPLVFINAAGSKAAQMFTLAHELAHLWLGASGVSDVEAGCLPDQDVERWCNRVAAEVLMPLEETHESHQPGIAVLNEIQRLAQRFKVSTLVALRRLFDGGLIDQGTLGACYRQELDRIRALDRGGSGGGDFDRTLGARTGRRFARAVMSSTLEGQTLFQDAFRMLGVRKTATLDEAARAMGVML